MISYNHDACCKVARGSDERIFIHHDSKLKEKKNNPLLFFFLLLLLLLLFFFFFAKSSWFPKGRFDVVLLTAENYSWNSYPVLP